MTTIVSCYYKFPSKHSHEEYDEWMNNFLLNIPNPIVIFTSPDLVSYIMSKRINFLKNTHIIARPFEELELYKEYIDKWDYQYSIDKQHYTGRTKECYVVWNSKLKFVKETIEVNPFNTDKFIWSDIGCLRTSNANIISEIANKYPQYDKISNTQIDFVLLNPVIPSQKIFIDECHFSGAMFGGQKDKLLELCNHFYKQFDANIKQNIFIGCDQQTICSVYNEHRYLFNCISTQHIINDNWKWFYLWLHYSNQQISNIIL